MKVSTSSQTTMPTSHTTQFFTGRMPFLLPNQQHQSTEGTGIKLLKQPTYVKKSKN